MSNLIVGLNFYLVDIVANAQTGSGKTAAFLLPIINEIFLHKERVCDLRNSEAPYLLILSPTKELAEQLATDARSFCEGFKYFILCNLNFCFLSIFVYCLTSESLIIFH